jgi:hypothetical protein
VALFRLDPRRHVQPLAPGARLRERQAARRARAGHRPADGRRIVFADRNIETSIVRAPIDLARQELSAPPAPLFSGSFELREQKLSPAGDWILFTNEDLPQQLHLVRPDGSGYRQLTVDGERNRQGSWSPQGDWIVFQTTKGDTSLAAIRPDGGGWQSLPVGLGLTEPIWSPDGSTIVAFDSSKGAFLYDVRAGLGTPKTTALPAVSPGLLFWPVAWSPDGALLVGYATRAGQTEGVATYSFAQGEYRVYPWRIHSTSSLTAAFLDGRRFAFNNAGELWLGDLASGDTKRLYSAPSGHQIFSVSAPQKGHWLAWIDLADESDIWLLTLDEPDRFPSNR